jgi:hypothetical protein
MEKGDIVKIKQIYDFLPWHHDKPMTIIDTKDNICGICQIRTKFCPANDCDLVMVDYQWDFESVLNNNMISKSYLIKQ